MKYVIATSVFALMSASPAAFAQTASTPVAPATAPAKLPGGTQPNAANTDAQEQLVASLKQAGFTDIKVVSESFFVHATDKVGNPVIMLLRPNSMTFISESAASDKAAGRTGSGLFATVATTDDLSSKVVGLQVYNAANQDIGAIKDLAFDKTNVKAYIVGVGGFMGMGEHNVAVRPSAIALSYDVSDKKWHAKTDITAEQLRVAPDAVTLTPQAGAGGAFTSIQSIDDLNSQIVGLSIYNKANTNIGTIKDVAFNAHGVAAYIVGVGHFLGISERYVAVQPSAITLAYDSGEKKWHAALEVTADQLQAAPEYKYAN